MKTAPPLAERLRPQNLTDFIVLEHLTRQGGLLRNML